MRKTTGSIKKVKVRGKRKWQVRMTFTEATTGKRVDVKRLFDMESEARVHLTDLLLEHRKAGTVEKITGQLTFTDVAERYETLKIVPAVYEGEHKLYGQSDLATPKSIIKILKGHFGKKLLRNISHSDLERFRLERLQTPTRYGKPRTVRTVNGELAMMNTILNFAVRNGWLSLNPFKLGDPLINKKAENKRERTLSFDEERRLLEACINERSHLRPIIITAVDTGLRQGELFKLEWTMLDFAGQMMHLPARITKTKKARSVALTERTLDELWKLRESTPIKQTSVFGIKCDVKRAWATACRMAEITDLRFHDLRHTFVTRAIAGGVSVGEAMKASGHVTLAMLARYLNPDLEAVKRVASALDTLHTQQARDFELTSQLVN